MGAKPPAAPAPAPDLSQRWLELWQHPELLLMRLVLIAAVLLLATFIYLLVKRLLGRLHRRLTARSETAPETVRRRLYRSITLLGLLSSVAKWLIFLSGLLWALSIAGMNLWPVLTGAGIAGIAIGLGAQSLIRDFLSGFFILLEGQFAVGDYVSIGGVFGVVEEVGLRVTVLRDLAGQAQYLPNGGIAAVTVFAEPRLHYELELELADEAQARIAARVLGEVLADARAVFAPSLPDFTAAEVLRLSGGLAAIRCRLAVFPQREWLATEEVPGRLLRRLKARGIEPPGGLKPRIWAAGPPSSPPAA